tara:strand:+ start:720 stop:2567 length:1848 start_codon:yes stop_codon:yes gene_type:complete
MSLVILSSQQTFNQTQTSQTIENPSQFQNYFSKPVTIEPNSEVAVISAKINRSQNFNVSRRNNMKVYLGTELDENTPLNRTTSMPINIPLFDADDQSLSTSEFVDRVQDRLDDNILHPEFIDRSVVSASINTSTKELVGFDIVIDSAKNGGGNSSSVSENWSAFSDDTNTFDVSACGTYGRIISASGRDNCIAVGIDKPLANSGGQFIFEPTGDATREWAVGLSRPNNIVGNPYGEPTATADDVVPAYFDESTLPGNLRGYYDFLVYSNGVKLEVYQSGNFGVDSGIGFGQTGLDEIVYWESVNSSYNGSGSPVDPSIFTDYRITINNEFIKIEGFEDSAYKTIISAEVSQTVAFDKKTKAISQNEWSLYPVVELFGATNNKVHIKRFNGATKPDDSLIGFFTETYYSTRTNSDDWTGFLHVNSIDMRRFNNMERTSSDHTYKGLRSNGANVNVDKNAVLLLAEEELYTPRALFPTPTSDLRDFFGFDVAIVNESVYAVLSTHENNRTFTSTTAPIKNSTRQAFIKIDSLNIESFNGGTSDISKILYSIPRFDNTGSSVGALFFENSDRYYLKLNNPSPIQLNRIDCSIVGIDNIIVDTLNGNTIVALHFRKSQS